MKYLLLLILISCSDGRNGFNGARGLPGQNVELDSIILSVDRAQTPWADNNKTQAPYDLIVYLPSSFEFTNLTSTENGGWIDIIVGNKVYCYQGKFGTRVYEYKYLKSEGATSGCDQNNDKFKGSVSFVEKLKKNDLMQIIPRAPRLNGVYNELSLTTLGVNE